MAKKKQVDRSIGNEPTSVIKLESGEEFLVPSDFRLGDAISHIYTPEVKGESKKQIKKLLTLDRSKSKPDDYKILLNGEHVSINAKIDKENKVEIDGKLVE